MRIAKSLPLKTIRRDVHNRKNARKIVLLSTLIALIFPNVQVTSIQGTNITVLNHTMKRQKLKISLNTLQ